MLLAFCSATHAGMGSENYRITTTAFSSGGGSSGSESFQVNATLGQSSPLMDSNDPPYSSSYDLYPGFWYTLEGGFAYCFGDMDFDYDIDGADLFFFSNAFGTASGDADYSPNADDGGDGLVDDVDLEAFADQFGTTPCP